MAAIVSAMAIVWPLLIGGPRAISTENRADEKLPAQAQPRAKDKDHGDAERRADASKKALERREVCDGFPAALTLHDERCDGAFAHFMKTVRSAGPLAPDDGTKGCWPIADDGTERFIALLPDPIDTGMRTSFDHGLLAVLRAFSERYYLDRFWSPWQDPGLSGDAEPGAVSACAARMPAVFTFRCSGAQNENKKENEGEATDPEPDCRDAELFVVGENPTSRVDRDAFALALALADRAAGARIDPREQDIRIIGPTFSGSAASVVDVLAAAGTLWPEPLPDPRDGPEHHARAVPPEHGGHPHAQIATPRPRQPSRLELVRELGDDVEATSPDASVSTFARTSSTGSDAAAERGGTSSSVRSFPRLSPSNPAESCGPLPSASLPLVFRFRRRKAGFDFVRSARVLPRSCRDWGPNRALPGFCGPPLQGASEVRKHARERGNLAEEEGFEPTDALRRRRFSNASGHRARRVRADSSNLTETGRKHRLFACLGQPRWGLEGMLGGDGTRRGATRNDAIRVNGM